jgi:DNA-binding NarL/FixJ family response regulator
MEMSKLLRPTAEQLQAARAEAERRVREATPPITQAQLDLFAMRANGHRVKTGGDAMGLSEKAALRHMAAAAQSLGTSSSWETLAVLLRAGLI